MLSLPTLLIVAGKDLSKFLRFLLRDDFDVHCVSSFDEAKNVLQYQWVQIILCEALHPLPDTAAMPSSRQAVADKTGISGQKLNFSALNFMQEVGKQWPEVIGIIIANKSGLPQLSEAIQQVPVYYVIHYPWQADELKLTLRNAAELFGLRRQNEQLALELKLHPGSYEQVINTKRALLMTCYDGERSIVRTPHSKMDQVCELVRNVAPYDVNVVLTGESGTGKELCAQALHGNSLRREAPFVAENCGALPDDLLESELFGYKRGAFTGATEDHAGLFECANGGTIFLDEIGDISPSFQVKLLRVLQEGEIRPLGSSERQRVDVRVIAATNRDLESDVKERRFRMDLYYRLATFSMHLPALRERPDDIVPIACNILNEAMVFLGKRVKGFTREALQFMKAYPWPGNVRELQNEVKRMLVLGQQEYLGAELLSYHILQAVPEQGAAEDVSHEGSDGSLKERVETLESRILKETLIRHRWNKTRAAEELGLSRVGLRNKLARYELEQSMGVGAQ